MVSFVFIYDGKSDYFGSAGTTDFEELGLIIVDHKKLIMTLRGEVLVAIMKDLEDMNIACNQHWYRIPVASIKNHLKKRWPPNWLAFYQPKVFGSEAFAVKYYARVERIQEVFRCKLFPDAPQDKKSQQRYYKLALSPLECLPQPIFSRRLRRIVFISTTKEKLMNAVEINDLWDESPLEDRMWAQLKQLEINAERQEFVKVKKNTYALDFAIYCDQGKINVETDGDTWHGDKQRIHLDNERDNDLETIGWRTLRFNTYHVQEEMAEYCIPIITENINRLGGLKQDGRIMPRKINSNGLGNYEQLTLF